MQESEFLEALRQIVPDVSAAQGSALFVSSQANIERALDQFFSGAVVGAQAQEAHDPAAIQGATVAQAEEALAAADGDIQMAAAALAPVTKSRTKTSAAKRNAPTEKVGDTNAVLKRARARVAAVKRKRGSTTASDTESDSHEDTDDDIDNVDESDDDMDEEEEKKDEVAKAKAPKKGTKAPRKRALRKTTTDGGVAPAKKRTTTAVPRKKAVGKRSAPKTTLIQSAPPLAENARNSLPNHPNIPADELTLYGNVVQARSTWVVGHSVLFRVEDTCWFGAKIVRIRRQPDAIWMFDVELMHELPGLVCPSMAGSKPLFSVPASDTVHLASYDAKVDMFVTPDKRYDAKKIQYERIVGLYRYSNRSRSTYLTPSELAKRKPPSASASASIRLAYHNMRTTDSERAVLKVEDIPESMKDADTMLSHATSCVSTVAYNLTVTDRAKACADLKFLLAAATIYNIHQLVDVCVQGEWLLGVISEISADSGLLIKVGSGSDELCVTWPDVMARVYPVAYQHAHFDVSKHQQRRETLNGHKATTLVDYYRQVDPNIAAEAAAMAAAVAAAPHRGLALQRSYVGNAKFYVFSDQPYFEGMNKTNLKSWIACLLPAPSGSAANTTDILARWNSDASVNARMLDALNQVRKDHVPNIIISEITSLPAGNFLGDMADHLHKFGEDSATSRGRFYDRVVAAVSEYYRLQVAKAKLEQAKADAAIVEAQKADANADVSALVLAASELRKQAVLSPKWDDLRLPNDAPVASKRVSPCGECGFRHETSMEHLWGEVFLCPVTAVVKPRMWEIEWPITMDDFQRMDTLKHDILCGMFPEVAAEYHRVQSGYMVDIAFPMPIKKLQDLTCAYHAYKARESEQLKQYMLRKMATAVVVVDGDVQMNDTEKKQDIQDPDDVDAPPEYVRQRYEEFSTDLDGLSIDEFSKRCYSELPLFDYQMQSILWMYRKEYDFGDARKNSLVSVNAPFWSHQRLRDGSELYYSPFFDKIQSEPLPNIRGGWLSESMGLGKTMEIIALINATLVAAKQLAQTRPNLYQEPLLDPEELALQHVPRDFEGRYYAHTTLVICPVNLIAQWVDECQTVSTRPLKILQLHSNTKHTSLAEMIQFDIVITAYSMMPSLMGDSSDHCELERRERPWAVSNASNLCYRSNLFRVHWHRVVLDESHLMKNNAGTVFKAAEQLYSQRRWLLSGTPYGQSVLELRSQCQFLQIQHMDHSFFDTALKPLMADQATLQRYQQQQRHRDRDRQRRGLAPISHNDRNGLSLAAAAHSDGDESDSGSEDDGNNANENRAGNAEEQAPSDDEVDEANQTPEQLEARRLRHTVAAAKRAKRQRHFEDFIRAMEAPADMSNLDGRVDVPLAKRRKYAVGNTIFKLICHNMMRHVKDQEYLGRQQLFQLPTKQSDVVEVELSDHQRAVYKKMLHIAQTRYKELKNRGLVARQALVVAKMLDPMRRACSSAHVDVATIEAEIERIEGIMKEMIANPKAAINLLPAFGDEADDCAICMCEMERAVQTPCRHTFCQDCLNGWGKTTCPSCRAPFEWHQISLAVWAKKAGDKDEDMLPDALLPEEIKAAEAAAAAAAPADPNSLVRESARPDTLNLADFAQPNREFFGHKIVQLVAELREMKQRDPHAKALVFTQFAPTFENVKKALALIGTSYVSLQGNMSLGQRGKALALFSSNPDIDVLVLSTRTGAVGLTLTAASNVFMMDPCLDPAKTKQAEDRVHRLGQKRPVYIKHFITAHSIEGTIYQIGQEKLTGGVQAAPVVARGARNPSQANVEAAALGSNEFERLFADTD